MADLQGDSGPAIDPNTACIACGSEEQPETMLICDSCQQGFHLGCFGLAVIPEEDQWVCAGCTVLHNLQPGTSILLESPQVLYADGSDPHLTQGLFKGTITSLENIQQDSTCTFRGVQAEMDLAPVAGSLCFYSRSTFKQLVRPPKPSLQLAKQLYELPGAELSTIVLSSRRHNMFGSPAAAAGLATEAWCIGETVSIASALQALAQSPKQDYLLHSNSRRSKATASGGLLAAQAPSASWPKATSDEPARPVTEEPQQQQPATANHNCQPLAETAAPAQVSWYPMPMVYPFMQPIAQAAHMQNSLASEPVAPAAHPMQDNNVAPAMPFFYPPMMPFGWPFGPLPNQYGSAPKSVLVSQHPASNWHQGIAVPAADQSISAAVAPQQARAKRVKQQLLVQEAYRANDDSDAADTSDDDWIGQAQVAPASAQVTKVVYKVLSTPRAKGSRMMINPSLAKQKARTVCAVGLPLFRHVISSAKATTANSRAELSPSQIKQAVAGFSDKDSNHKAFLNLKENRNLVKHIGTLLQVLSVNDDPLTIEADIVTSRVLSCVQLQGQRKTSLNNALSHCRSGFRLLFGRCLLPGIECATTTVKVGSDVLRIDLHSPLPDGAVTDFGEALEARGTLKREAQGCIRTLETTQLHILYAWHEILSQLSALRKWSSPEFIPARILDQLNRWSCILLAWHLRGLVDNGRPSDVSLYHIGCFNLVLPNQHKTPLAAAVLSSLQQQQQQHSIDEILEVYRSAGAVLHIKIPKCKQDQRKRSSNGGSPVSWLDVYKPLLDPALTPFCPARSIAFSMAVSWYVKGAVSARLLSVRRLGSSKAAPKRHMQPDFQSATGSACWKVLTAGDLHSYIPVLYLLQQQQQSSSSGVDSDSSRSSSDSGSCEEEDNSSSTGAMSGNSATPSQAVASSSGGTTAAAAAATTQQQQQYMLLHTKPRKASKLQVVLKLRQLSGYDQRHSLQKDLLQTGIPLELAAKLASHSADETKRYASNCCYELSDSSAMPLKLASPEWTSKDLVPLPLTADSKLEGVPAHLDIFRSPTLNMGPAAAVRSVADPKLAAVLSSSGLKDSVKVMQSFIDSFSSEPKLNSLLHEPVLGGSTDEPLPVKLLRDIPGILHLRSGAAVGEFLSRLPAFSAAGIAAPTADRLVHPALADVYNQLAKNAAALSSKLAQKGSKDAASVQLVVKHYAQVTFGRLDIAWKELAHACAGS